MLRTKPRVIVSLLAEFNLPGETVITDISENGLSFFFPFPVKTGTIISLEIGLSDKENIVLKVRVHWCRQENGRYLVGAQVHQMGGADRIRFAQLRHIISKT